jgi:hypothetical protein
MQCPIETTSQPFVDDVFRTQIIHLLDGIISQHTEMQQMYMIMIALAVIPAITLIVLAFVQK